MKVGIPTLGNKGLEEEVASHFGRAPTYTIVDTETGDVKIVDNRSEHFGGLGKPPEMLASNKVEIMLCSGLGPRAIHLFENYGIEVFVGASGTVKNTIEEWKAGKLRDT